MHIGYLSECAKDYTAGLKKCCDSLDRLAVFVKEWRELAPDAYAAVFPDGSDKTITEEEFAEFQRGHKIESRGKYAGDEWAAKYGMIILPEILLRVELIAEQYKVPFGTAFVRLEEMGYLVHDGNAYQWKEPQQA